MLRQVRDMHVEAAENRIDTAKNLQKIAAHESRAKSSSP
jgi:hypothetical protein